MFHTRKNEITDTIWSERNTKSIASTSIGSPQVYHYYNKLFAISFLLLSCRSTPIETLHTILLGPYKYLLRSIMGRLSTIKKNEIQARVMSLDFSGLSTKLSYNLCRHYRSFVGRDFKVLAQVGLYLLGPYLTPDEKAVWLALSKVNCYLYCVSSCHYFLFLGL